MAVSMETVKDWGDTVEWLENIGSVGGLGMSCTVVLGRTGVEAHWTNVLLCHCARREGSRPCARVLLRGCTEIPTVGAFFLGGSHWASWSEEMTEAPSMMGLHAAGTASADSSPLDALLVGSTAERTATRTRDPGTCYAATSCKKGALPGGDLVHCSFSPHRTGTGAFQTDWKERENSFESSQNSP